MSPCANRFRAALISLILCVPVLSCQSTITVHPRCPIPSRVVIDDLQIMIYQNDYHAVQEWISEMERYCVAVDSMVSMSSLVSDRY